MIFIHVWTASHFHLMSVCSDGHWLRLDHYSVSDRDHTSVCLMRSSSTWLCVVWTRHQFVMFCLKPSWRVWGCRRVQSCCLKLSLLCLCHYSLCVHPAGGWCRCFILCTSRKMSDWASQHKSGETLQLSGRFPEWSADASECSVCHHDVFDCFNKCGWFTTFLK